MRACLRTASSASFDSLVADLEESVQALIVTLEAPIGLNVSQAADSLGVSQPTVRKWIRAGLLEPVPGRSPAEVTPASAAEAARILRFVRERFPAREWSSQLAAFLHDRELQRQDWALEGIDQARRGEHAAI